ncbi:MAG: polyprenyl synthetase family protein [Thermoguttaceae bacterium]|nr:polyprenyl synthetase family protein [Thermoguttaceae bacterium]
MSTSLPCFADYATRLRAPIDAALSARCPHAAGAPPRLTAAMRYALLAPGKRLRPMLALLAAEACGAPLDRAMPGACAVEMVHAYSLVHDDLPAMDDDDLRRGRPTCHKEFDEATAILAGDALLALAFEVLATEVRPPETAVACCAALAQAAGRCHLVGGQADDMHPPQPDQLEGENGLETLEGIHLRKTGALIRASLRLGGLCAGAEAQQLAALDRYGRCVGLAFQIADDLLDVMSNTHALGKRVGKDAAQGKLTFPGLLGIEPSRVRAEQLIDDACEAVAPFGSAADGLASLARFVLERKR